MYAGTLHTHAGTYRVYAVVVRFHSYFRFLSRYAHHFLYRYDAVGNLRYFLLEKAFEEKRIHTREYHVGFGTAYLDGFDKRFDRLAFAERIGRYLLLARKHQFILVLVVYYGHLWAHMVCLSCYYSSLEVFETFENGSVVVLEYTGHEVLAKRQYGAASEVFYLHFLGYFLTHFKVVLYLAGFRKRHFSHRVFDLSVGNHDTVAPYLKVPLVGVYHDVEVVVRAELLFKGRAENFFEDSREGQAVYLLKILKFGKRIY